MFNSNFTTVKAAMHAYSRSPLAKGQVLLDQVNTPAGHNVSYDRVRAEKIPAIATVYDRDAFYLEEKNGGKIVGNELGRQYASVLRFIDKGRLEVIPGTNGESYIILDQQYNVCKNFIGPSDVPIDYKTLSNGYEIRMFADDGVTEIPQDVGWTFDYFNGIIHFDQEAKPGSEKWVWGAPTVEAFVYTGKYISELLESINTNQNVVTQQVQNATNSLIAIQQFKFTSQNMTTVGDPYPIENSRLGVPDYFQRLSMVIPAYVFELIGLDKNETIFTDIMHLPNGDSLIFFDVPWYVEEAIPIISYTYDSGEDGLGTRIPVVGKYKFLATGFVQNDGSKIQLRPMKDYEENPNDVIPSPAVIEPSTSYESGVPVTALHPQPLGMMPPPPPPHHHHRQNTVNINC